MICFEFLKEFFEGNSKMKYLVSFAIINQNKDPETFILNMD